MLNTGLRIKKQFDLGPTGVLDCFLTEGQDECSLELSHRCPARLRLYQEVARLVPALVQGDGVCGFRTLNKGQNITGTCLFEGAKLELTFVSGYLPEFGICFPRSAFVAEREQFEQAGGLDTLQHQINVWSQFERRSPSDAERLRVNQAGWEAVYFVKPPSNMPDLTFTQLISEVCHSFQIADPRRITLRSGPLSWPPEYKDDGLGLFSTYYHSDIVNGTFHTKTIRGAALIGVMETSASQIDEIHGLEILEASAVDFNPRSTYPCPTTDIAM